MDASTDAEDWTLALQGDGEAFGRVFDRHGDRIFRHSLKLVPLPHDAEDVVAVAFFEAWRRRESVRFVHGSLLPWLLVTATNASRNLNRSARRYQSLLARLPAPEPAPDHADGFGDSEAVIALRRLSLAHQHVITLCVLEGLSEADAASVLGVAQGTVKSRLWRARQRLAAELGEPTPGISLEGIVP